MEKGKGPGKFLRTLKKGGKEQSEALVAQGGDSNRFKKKKPRGEKRGGSVSRRLGGGVK